MEEFRLRAREWLSASMPRLESGQRLGYFTGDDDGTKTRQLQRIVFDGGYAGLCFPVEYGGRGLHPRFQQVFTEESAPFVMPLGFNIPTLSILAPTLLDFGTEEQKQRHIPAILQGDELWVQFLSEPTGGSDLAGLMTRATRDGDVWLLNGSKIWSSGAFRADYALCLARTDWHVEKHRGLTMFIVAIRQPGIEVQRIKMVNGSEEFCQEFFDDVLIPQENVVGTVNDGWTVASRLLHHERTAVGGSSPYTSGTSSGEEHGDYRNLLELARITGQAGDGRVRQLVADAVVHDTVQTQLIEEVSDGLRAGRLPAAAGSLVRLFAATNSERYHDAALEIAGPGAGAWDVDEPAGKFGVQYLRRQEGSLGGGSNEMQRNIISERILGMPREHAPDRDRPFDEVDHNAVPGRRS